MAGISSAHKPGTSVRRVADGEVDVYSVGKGVRVKLVRMREREPFQQTVAYLTQQEAVALASRLLHHVGCSGMVAALHKVGRVEDLHDFFELLDQIEREFAR